MGKQQAYMIFDLQFGSTGKGLLAGYLAEELRPDTVMTAWGPNAGHTYIDDKGRKFVHRMLANGVVSPALKRVLIGPGSVIDLDCLEKEIYSCRDLLDGVHIVIHPQAVVLNDKHSATESVNVKIGSTMKGTGAAVIDRIKRDLDNPVTAYYKVPEAWLYRVWNVSGAKVTVCKATYDDAVRKSDLMQIEGAQGYSLSLYHGFYPYTTSRDVTPSQVCADVALPFSIKPLVYGTLRTFPIRVANRYNSKGGMIGTSGPGYPDQRELTWDEVGIPPELTTVTKLPRRIFSFSSMQFLESLNLCCPDFLFLNFMNYLSSSEQDLFINKIQGLIGESQQAAKISYLGQGDSKKWVLPFGGIKV